MSDVSSLIRIIPDYPTAGIMFHDIFPCLADPAAFKLLINSLAAPYRNLNIAVVAGIEARGFILAAAVAGKLGAGFIPIRKKGKLPPPVLTANYSSEYSDDTVAIAVDAVKKGQRVLLIDDLIATGSTVLAAASLIKRRQGELVKIGAFIELSDLPGGNLIRAAGYDLFSLSKSYGSKQHYQTGGKLAP